MLRRTTSTRAEGRDFRLYSQPLTTATIFVSSLASLGGVLFGYDMGATGSVTTLPSFQSCFNPEPHESRNVTTFFTIGAAVGALALGNLADWSGRRNSIVASAVVYSLASVLQVGAPSLSILYIGRVLCGFGIGGLSSVVPIYVVECSPDHSRGRLTTMWQLGITSGIVVAQIVNVTIWGMFQGEETYSWRIPYGFNLLGSTLYFASMALCAPESPRWLLMRENTEAGHRVLYRLRPPDEAEAELSDIQVALAEQANQKMDTWRDLFSHRSKMVSRLLLGAALQFVQQLTGINAVVWFFPELMKGAYGDQPALYGLLGLNMVNQLSTYATFFTVERTGRVTLLLLGGALMSSVLLCLSIMFGSVSGLGYVWLALAGAALFVISFAFTWGPVVWTTCAEMFPLCLRAKATSVTTMVNWVSATAVGLVFPMLVTGMSSGTGLAVWTAINVVVVLLGTAMVYAFLPELTGVPLPLLDEAFSKYKPAWRRYPWRDAMNSLIARRNRVAGGTTAGTGHLAVDGPAWSQSDMFSGTVDIAI